MYGILLFVNLSFLFTLVSNEEEAKRLSRFYSMSRINTLLIGHIILTSILVILLG